MHHGDVPDDVGQALVEKREDDDVQSGPLGLETEPEAKPSAEEAATCPAVGPASPRLLG